MTRAPPIENVFELGVITTKFVSKERHQTPVSAPFEKAQFFSKSLKTGAPRSMNSTHSFGKNGSKNVQFNNKFNEIVKSHKLK